MIFFANPILVLKNHGFWWISALLLILQNFSNQIFENIVESVSAFIQYVVWKSMFYPEL